MSTGTVELAVDGGIARVTLSNPARYNAMSLSMWIALADTIEQVDAMRDVRVVLLRGAGDKAFVSGADISEFESQRNGAESVGRYDAAVARAQNALSHSPKPVVAGISGVCMGGGIGLALACDLRYARKDARFRMPAARIGLGYGLEGMQRMVDVIGAARASDLFFTARTFDGNEAERIGLVHSAHDPVAFESALEQAVTSIAHNAPLSLYAAKLAIRAAAERRGGADAACVAEAVTRCFSSADYREGRQAFMEKRAPRFTGE
jgi:enoyl-CoA hydratase/carnithine racemase